MTNKTLDNWFNKIEHFEEEKLEESLTKNIELDVEGTTEKVLDQAEDKLTGLTDKTLEYKNLLYSYFMSLDIKTKALVVLALLALLIFLYMKYIKK